MGKDIYGYTTAGGYTGMSRSSRRNRNKTLEKKWIQGIKDNKKPKEYKEPTKKGLIMLIIGIIIILSVIIKVNLF